MKKTIFIVLFACLVVSLTAIPTFAQAETVTTVTATTTLQDIVAEKLGAGDYTYEFLAGFSKADRYTLVEGVNKYLIFDNVLQDFVEYSDSSNSEYFDLPSDATKMYLGPTYYFYQQGGAVIDMENGQQLDESAVAACALYEQESLISRFSIQQSSQPTAITNQTQAMGDLTDEEMMYIYFSNLKRNMGVNESNCEYPGSSGIVAMGMMLSYFDTFRDDNIIDEEFDVTSEEYSFSLYSDIGIKAYEESPGTDASFQKHLIDIGYDLLIYGSYTSNFAIDHKQSNAIFNHYLTTRGIDATVIDEEWKSNNQIGNLISQYGPLLLTLQVEISSLYHDVVAYAYSDEEITANIGARSIGFNFNIIKEKIQWIQYVQFANDEHTCSDNYRWKCNGSTGSLCPCGKIKCNHEVGIIWSIDDTKHCAFCKTCGIVVPISDHAFGTNGLFMYKCRVCSYVKDHTHSYTYTPKPGRFYQHGATCTLCGTTKTEQCIGRANAIDGTSYCAKCGQDMSGGGLEITDFEDELEMIAATLQSLASPLSAFQVVLS